MMKPLTPLNTRGSTSPYPTHAKSGALVQHRPYDRGIWNPRFKKEAPSGREKDSSNHQTT